MYGGYAEHERHMQILKESRTRLKNDPEYRRQFIADLGLEELFSQMTEEDWKRADAKYGYKEG